MRPIDRYPFEGGLLKENFFRQDCETPFEKTLQSGMRATLLIALSNRWPIVESWKLSGKIEARDADSKREFTLLLS